MSSRIRIWIAWAITTYGNTMLIHTKWIHGKYITEYLADTNIRHDAMSANTEMTLKTGMRCNNTICVPITPRSSSKGYLSFPLTHSIFLLVQDTFLRLLSMKSSYFFMILYRSFLMCSSGTRICQILRKRSYLTRILITSPTFIHYRYHYARYVLHHSCLWPVNGLGRSS